MKTSVKSYVSGPRWVGLGRFLREAAMHCDLEIQIEREHGLIRETLFFKVEGEQENIEKMDEILQRAKEEYES